MPSNTRTVQNHKGSRVKAAGIRARTYEYRVLYRLRWWPRPRSRRYQTAGGARRFVARLCDPWEDLGDLEPLEVLSIQRRPVGDWENMPVEELGWSR